MNRILIIISIFFLTSTLQAQTEKEEGSSSNEQSDKEAVVLEDSIPTPKPCAADLASAKKEIAALSKELKEKELRLARIKKSLGTPTSVEQEIRDSLGNMASKIHFGGYTFDVYHLASKELEIELFWRDKKTHLYSLGALKKHLEEQGKELLFACNAGMYTKERLPQGLFIQEGKERAPLDARTEGYGNFYLQPNGVFMLDKEGTGHVMTTKKYLAVKDSIAPNFATQSGPMLVFDGQINQHFFPGSTNYNIRNGVGIDAEGNIVLVISNEPLNLHTFARFFKDYYKCDNALYLDGAISKTYIKDLGREQMGGKFGPMIGVYLSK